MKIHSFLWKVAFATFALGAFAGPRQVHADTAIFQDGATTPFTGGTYGGTRDTMLYTNGGGYFNSSNDNRGTVPSFDVGNSGALGTDANRRAVIKFDLSSLTGHYTAITGVTLRLTADGNVASNGNVNNDNTVNLFRMANANAGWAEGVGGGGGTYGPEDAGGASWANAVNGAYDPNNQFAGTRWAGTSNATNYPNGGEGHAEGAAGVAGTDYIATAISSIIYTNTSGANGQTVDFVFNDVSFINQWVTGTNAGMLLRQSFENTTDAELVGFNSREATTQSVRPELIVTFTPTPEPGPWLLAASGLAVCAARIRWRAKRQAE